MSVETTSETMEQQISTVGENSLKQSEPDFPDIELPDDDPNESTPSTSKKVLTIYGLKRPSPDGVDGDKKKKIRPTEVSEDELEVTNKDDNKASHVELLLQKVSESPENTSDDESNVSNKTHDNLKNENVAVVNDIQVTENISTAVNDTTVRESNSNLSNTKIYTIENIVNGKKDDANPLLRLKNKIHLTKNTNETKSIQSPCNSNTNNSEKVDVCSNGIYQNFELIDSDNSSDISLSDLTDLPEDISSIISGAKPITKENFPQLLKLFSSKESTFEQIYSMCTQKIIEIMTEKSFWGNDRSELQLLKKREKLWQSKYSLLDRQFKEMKLIVNVHKQELKSNEYARPHLVTRNVGLQAKLCPRKEGSMKLPKQAIPLPRPDPVSFIVEDDDDDVVEVEFETVESASSSTSKITNTSIKKKMPPLITTSKMLKVSTKNVTGFPKTVNAAKSLNLINIGTAPTTIIDLTGNDDGIEESNIINLEDSIPPIKIARRIPVSLLPAETLVRFPRRTIVLNKDTINTSPKSKNLKPILIEDSDNSSDISLSDLNDLREDISSIISGAKSITEESFPSLLKLFSSKESTYEQFYSMCTQKIIGMMTEKSFWGNDHSELQLLKKRVKLWQSKYSLLDREFKEMKLIVNVHNQELKSNEYARPHLVTRTVGLQAKLCPRKEGSMKLLKQAIPLPRPDPVSFIVEDDDDDVVELEFETVESASSSTSKITNTSIKKKMPPLITTSKMLKVSTKNVTGSPKTVNAAKSLNLINIGTAPTTIIDLTGNDDGIEESNIINLEDSIPPIKIARRIPVSLLPAETLVRFPRRTIVLNKDTINTSPKSKNLKPILIEVSRVDPVLVQPCTVTYTAHRVPVSRTLQPMSTASYAPRNITISQLYASLRTLTPSYTTRQIPASRISGSMSGIALPQASPGKSYTTCQVPLLLRSIHHTGSQSTRKPPPLAIPLLGHPSPVPGIPNQKSLSAWKRLPPAPNLTISKSSEVQNMPQALVLSWTMNVNRTIAEVISYQIYAYQETPDQPPSIDLWKKIGDVNALPLPMACSLTHFSNGQKYHFLVRAVDVYTRVGPFSTPKSIL